jgi:hypothetical protein
LRRRGRRAAPPATLALTQVVVTIDRVEVRVEDGPWTALPTARTTVDLMAVRTTNFASLGIAQVPAGDVVDTATGSWVLRPVLHIEEATAAGSCDDGDRHGPSGLHEGQEK